MKLTNFFCISTFAIALLIPTPRTVAQVTPTAVPGIDSFGLPRTSQPTEAPKKIASLKIKPDGTIKSAVMELKEAMKAAQLPDMNVICAPGAAEVAVPELNLGNVTGPDALRLIAVSANCQAESINDEKGDAIIGYLIRPSWKSAEIGFDRGLFGSGKSKPSPDRRNADTTTAPNVPEAANVTSVQPGPLPRTLSQNSFGSISDPAGAGDIVLVNSGEIPSVHVYPLGGVTSKIKFPEIEETLRDVLKADGIAGDAAKFAVHEGTNVLVVTGTGEVHTLVEQLLDALQQNHTHAEAANDLRETALREVTELKIRLSAEMEQRAKLNDQLAKSEAQLRELDQELNRLKATTVKPSPSAR